jgi:hypothetical protein
MEFRARLTLASTAVRHYVAVAGFWNASFEGGRKSGGEGGRLLD